jgi:hypothetical protein
MPICCISYQCHRGNKGEVKHLFNHPLTCLIPDGPAPPGAISCSCHFSSMVNKIILEVKKRGLPQGGAKQRIRAKRRIPTVSGGYLCSVDSVRLDSCPPFWHLISQCYEHSYSTTHSRDDDIITRQPKQCIVHHPCVILNCVT